MATVCSNRKTGKPAAHVVRVLEHSGQQNERADPATVSGTGIDRMAANAPKFHCRHGKNPATSSLPRNSKKSKDERPPGSQFHPLIGCHQQLLSGRSLAHCQFHPLERQEFPGPAGFGVVVGRDVVHRAAAERASSVICFCGLVALWWLGLRTCRRRQSHEQKPLTQHRQKTAKVSGRPHSSQVAKADISPPNQRG
jgi:hypothetical protein